MRTPAGAVMLLCACLLAGRAGAGEAPAPAPLAGPEGCPAMSTPLDPAAGSWVMTLYVPPALVPAITFPGGDQGEGGTPDDLLEALFRSGGSAVEVNTSAWFTAVGVFDYAWLAGAEPNPGKPLEQDSIRIRSMNITGPFVNPQNFPPQQQGGGGGGGVSPMAPSAQIYKPQPGLYDKMQAAAAGAPEGTVSKAQAIWCDKHGDLIVVMTDAAEAPPTLADLPQLSPALGPVLDVVKVADGSGADPASPIPYQPEWVRRSYFPTTFEGQPAGYVISNVAFASQEDAATGANPGKAELIFLAYQPNFKYAQELQRLALAAAAAMQEEQAGQGS